MIDCIRKLLFTQTIGQGLIITHLYWLMLPVSTCIDEFHLAINAEAFCVVVYVAWHCK